MFITDNETDKKLYSMNVWESNHDACMIAEVRIFKNLCSKRRAVFMFSLLKSISPCFLTLSNIFKLNHSQLTQLGIFLQLHHAQVIPDDILVRLINIFWCFLHLSFKQSTFVFRTLCYAISNSLQMWTTL